MLTQTYPDKKALKMFEKHSISQSGTSGYAFVCRAPEKEMNEIFNEAEIEARTKKFVEKYEPRNSSPPFNKDFDGDE
jgi:hypothetical protein